MSLLSKGPIKDFALGIFDGPHATPKESQEGPIFLGIKNVNPDGTLDLSSIRHIAEEDYLKWIRRVEPQPDDIVFSYEATLHRYAIIPEGFKGCLGRRMALIRPDLNMVNPKYLHYYLMSSKWKAIIESNIISGATVDRIPIKKFPEFELELPPLDIQNEIASILYSYVNLFENNQRRIQLLEESASLLYKEWFINLKFPRHEHVKIVDGVPEEWEITTYKEVFGFQGGFAFKSKTYQPNGKFGVVTIKNVHDAKFVTECPSRVDSIPEKMKPHCRLATGDILLSLTGNVGRVCIVYGENYLLNQRVAKVIGKKTIPQSYIYWALRSESQQRFMENLAHGVAQLNLSPVNLGEAEYIRPTYQLISLFDEVVEPILKQIITLNLQNQQLSSARDLLLPRLMNGEIEV